MQFFRITSSRSLRRSTASVSSATTRPSGGMDSAWGVQNVKEVTDKSPDLVFIGFGMNDGGKSGRTVANNIKRIMSKVKEQFPDCEFVVVAPMVPQRRGWVPVNAGRVPEVPSVSWQVRALPSWICSASIQSCWNGRTFIAMSGNNINHPNDWLIRVYTMNLMAAFLPYAAG